MLEQLKARLCCFNEDYQINIHIDLMNCKGFANSQKNFSASETQKWRNKISPSREILVDFSDYSFYMMIDFNRGSIDSETDFLYIRDETQAVPQKIEEILHNSVIPITENRFNSCTGLSQLSLSNIDPCKTYLIHYMRKNVKRNIVNSFFQTKKFKLSFKNKMHNLFLNSINPLNEEFTIIYENDPLFDRFDPSEIIKNHRRSLSFAFTGEINHSVKTRGSSKDSRMDDKPRTQGQATGKNSLFNTFISASDFNLPPQLSGQNTNKNSFAGDFHPSGKGLKFDYYKSIPVIPEQRLNHDNPEIHQSQVEFNSETMIIHDHRENDDYVKRMCIILAENLESTFPPGEHKEVSSNTINNTLEKSDKIQVKSKRPSLEHSKIFELLKSQERKDFSLNSTANLKISSPETKANLNISPDSIKKEFQIGSSHKKKKVSETVKPSNFRVEKNIITLLEEIEKDYDSKKSSPFKENMYAKNPMKASLDLENIHADFNGLALTSNQKLQRKPLQDISNKAVEFATAESQRDLPSSGTRFNNIITSEDSERNIQAQMTDNSDKDKENCAPDFSKITFRKPPTDYNMRLQLDAEVDLYCTEDINKETPRYNNEIDFKTNYYSPNYTDRLHTVEEVCSSSKESSTGGDYPIRSFNRSTSKREPMTSSVRAFTDQPIVNESDEFCDEVRLSIPPGTERSFSKDKDQSIEFMILKKKLDDIGMRTYYNATDRLISIVDEEDTSQKFMFKWYEEISEKDLNLYFREIVDNVQEYRKLR